MAYGNEVTTPASAPPSTTTALGLLAVAVALLVAAQLPSMRKNGRRSRKRMRRNGVRQAHGGWVAYQTDAQGREVAGFGPFPTKARAQAALDERAKLATMSRSQRIAYAWGPRGGVAAKAPRATAKRSSAKRSKTKPKAPPRARPKKKAAPRGGLTSIERLLMRKNGRVNLTRIASRIPDRDLRLVQGELDFWLSPKRKALALAGPNRNFPVVKIGSQHLTVGEAARLYPMIMRRIDATGWNSRPVRARAMAPAGYDDMLENSRRSYGPTKETTVEAAAAAGRLAGKKALPLFESRYHSVVRTSRNWEKMANAAISEATAASSVYGETYVLDREKETAYIDAFAEVLQDASYNAMIDPDTYQHDERYENW